MSSIPMAGLEQNEFLATLVHELRNPLGSIMSSVEVMKLAPANAGQVERARATIERQGAIAAADHARLRSEVARRVR